MGRKRAGVAFQCLNDSLARFGAPFGAGQVRFHGGGMASARGKHNGENAKGRGNPR